MCEVMEKYEQKVAERAAKEAAIKANVESIKFMIATLNASKSKFSNNILNTNIVKPLMNFQKNKKVCDYLKGSSHKPRWSFFYANYSILPCSFVLFPPKSLQQKVPPELAQ